MLRCLASAGALTMLTLASSGRSSPASTTWVSGRVLSAAAWPSYLIVTALQPGLGELAGERAQLLGQLHVGPQPRRLLGGDRRHVERVDDRAGDQEIAHLLGDLERDVLLRLAGRGAEMRRDETSSSPNSGDSLAGSSANTSSAAPATWPLADQVGQRLLVDQAAAGAVDDPHARPWSSPARRARGCCGSARSAACAA